MKRNSGGLENRAAMKPIWNPYCRARHSGTGAEGSTGTGHGSGLYRQGRAHKQGFGNLLFLTVRTLTGAAWSRPGLFLTVAGTTKGGHKMMSTTDL